MSSNYVNLTVRAHTDGSRSYYEHDDRRVEFTNRRGKKSNHRRGRHRGGGSGGGEGPFRVDEDGDVSMAPIESGGDRQSRYTPYVISQRRDGGNKYRRDEFRGPDRKDSHAASSSGGRGGNQQHLWNKVIVPHGRRLSKDYLLRTIAKNCSGQFIPINFQYDGNAAIFFLENKLAAAELGKARWIHSPEGQKFNIVVRPTLAPNVTLNLEAVQSIQAVVCRRYNAVTGTLDLSFFHLDHDFKCKGYYMALARHGVMSSTMKILNDTVTNLVVLDLTGNKLSSLNLLGDAMKKLGELKTMLLGQNELTKFSELNRLRSLPLEELTLNGNPLCNSYKDHSDYVDVVRKLFPKLMKLDGMNLPAQIGFELEKVVSLPTPQGSFFVSEESRNVVIQFLQQYFEIYDSQDRQGLLAAYHDSSMFSFTCFPHLLYRSTVTDYTRQSRNMLKVFDNDVRNRLLKHGKLEIISLLKSLPRTRHDPASIIVDVSLASPTILSFTACGIFKETENKAVGYPIRAFSRAFVLVPQEAGFCIVNETLVITSATEEQIKTAFKTPAPTPSPSPVPSQVLLPAAAPATVPIDENILREQMVTAFAQQSGMNIKWAAKCLQDNGWDYDKAAVVFTELKTHGHIPSEAFQS